MFAIDTEIKEEIDAEFIEARVLRLLKITIHDLEDDLAKYNDSECRTYILDGFTRFEVSRCGRRIGTISCYGDKYHPRLPQHSSPAGYDSVFEAVTYWIEPEVMETYWSLAKEITHLERSSFPDYT